MSRIVSTDHRGDEMLVALVEPSRILALSADADNSEISNVPTISRVMHPKVSGSLEELLALRPDFVIVSKGAPTDLLESAGIRVLKLNSSVTFADIRANISALGSALRVPERAEAIVAAMDRSLDEVRRSTSSGPRPRALYLYFGAAGIDTAGPDTYIGELLDVAGLQNAAIEMGARGWSSLSMEQILAIDPDVIIIPKARLRSSARDLVSGTGTPSFAWSHLRAAREGRVYWLPGRYLFAASQYTANAALLISATVHGVAAPEQP